VQKFHIFIQHPNEEKKHKKTLAALASHRFNVSVINGNIMEISWKYHGNIMGISWEYQDASPTKSRTSVIFPPPFPVGAFLPPPAPGPPWQPRRPGRSAGGHLSGCPATWKSGRLSGPRSRPFRKPSDGPVIAHPGENHFKKYPGYPQYMKDHGISPLRKSL